MACRVQLGTYLQDKQELAATYNDMFSTSTVILIEYDNAPSSVINQCEGSRDKLYTSIVRCRN